MRLQGTSYQAVQLLLTQASLFLFTRGFLRALFSSVRLVQRKTPMSCDGSQTSRLAQPTCHGRTCVPISILVHRGSPLVCHVGAFAYGVWQDRKCKRKGKKITARIAPPPGACSVFSWRINHSADMVGLCRNCSGFTLPPRRLSQYYQNPVFDSLAGVSIAGLLGVMGLVLTEVSRERRRPAHCCTCLRYAVA